jgi:hypothetical protein
VLRCSLLLQRVLARLDAPEEGSTVGLRAEVNDRAFCGRRDDTSLTLLASPVAG